MPEADGDLSELRFPLVIRANRSYCSAMAPGEFWSIQQVSAYWGVDQRRARNILREHGITWGYPADEVRAVPRKDKRAKTGLKELLGGEVNETITADSIQWSEPPPKAPTSSDIYKEAVRKFTAILKERPGQWAILPTQVHPRYNGNPITGVFASLITDDGVASTISSGRAELFGPGFEAAARRNGQRGISQVYVRFVGAEEAS
jgi:hypothetical protein